ASEVKRKSEKVVRSGFNIFMAEEDYFSAIISTVAESGKHRYDTAMSQFEIQRSSRRKFIKLSAAVAAAPFVGSVSHPAVGAEKGRFEFCTFTKPLQHLSYAEMSDEIAKLGFDGIEGPVRPGGHVLPERVEDDLPKMVEALKANDLNLTLMTSGINEVSEEQRTEAVLRTAADLGVKRFRMAYYRYDLKKPIAPQLDEFRARLKDLVAMTSELGIKPVYQNHSGKNYFGGPIWDLAEALEDFDAKDIGVAFDIGHATVEGAKAWPLNYARIRDYIDTLYIKEPAWDENTLGWGPIGEGVVDKSYFETVKKSDFSGPVSVHVEYLGHKDPKIVPAVLEAIKKDFARVKSLLT
ncbi:sugar phosphate isomerase/epimerase, partial [Verrucomicrobiales bacterium]|nr:sugar phosphate isomerase/epimerase [Verrucomicrobiales bacterium]